MSNPYIPPESDLGAEKEPIRKGKWKVFFWLLLSLEIISLIMMFIDPEETLTESLAELVVYSTILVGIYGFSYNKKIIGARLWAYMIPIGIMYDIYSLSTIDWAFESPEEMYLVVAFTCAIFLPLMYLQYLALFKYSFRSPEIWGKVI